MGVLIRPFLLSLVSCVLLLSHAPANAQYSQTSYVSEDRRHRVEWTENWSLNTDMSGNSSVGTTVMLHEDRTMVIFLFLPEDPGYSLRQMFAVYREGFTEISLSAQNLDSWEDSDSIRSLDSLIVEGIELNLYIRADEASTGSNATISTIVSPSERFVDDLVNIQDQIVVDDAPAFAGDDTDELSQRISGETPTESNAASSESARSQDLDGAGLYENAEYGFTVTYGPPWVLSSHSTVKELRLTEDIRFDSVRVLGMDSYGMEPREFIETMAGTYNGDMAPTGNPLDSVQANDRILMLYPGMSGGGFAQEFIFSGNGSVIIISVMSMSDIDAAVGSLQDAVMINDEPVMRDWDQLNT